MKKSIHANHKNDELIRSAVDQLVTMFTDGTLPSKVAFSIIRRNPNDITPSDKWSIGNRVLMLLQNTEDARGFRQWEDVGRHVTKGAHAIHIVAPLTTKIKQKDPVTGEEEEKIIVRGYRLVPVFRYEDTLGAPLPYDHIYTPKKSPVFINVAKRLGIDVSYGALRGNYLGKYSIRTDSIKLCAQDDIVYLHELSHAVHARIVDLTVYDPKKAEVVAEFSALVLAHISGIEGYESQGFDYIRRYSLDHEPAGVLREIFGVLADVEKIVQTVLSVADDESETDIEPQAV